MSSMRIELDFAGVGKLLKSEEMKSVLRSHGEATLAALGDGYGMRETMTDRAGVNVFANTAEAKRDNSQNNSILKALR